MHLAELSSSAVASLSRDIPVVIPVAALEQHSGHLPLYTDSFLLGEVVRRAHGVVGDRVLVAPLQWLGNSHHHLDFAGTLSAEPRSYLDLLVGLGENLVHHGFRRVVFVNGHGGNDVPGRQAVFELRQRFRERSDLLFVFATYWHLGGDVSGAVAGLVQREMGHACEWETSMMMVVAPQLVGEVGVLGAVPFGHGFEPGTRGWVTQDRTVAGYIGDPAAATAGKGEALLAHFGGCMARFLTRVVEWDGNSWDG